MKLHNFSKLFIEGRQILIIVPAPGWWFGRVIEDYVVLYCGSAMFKIARLLFVALLSIHFFASLFYRVKKESAQSQEVVDDFYTSKGVDPTVSKTHSMIWTRYREK